jgi:hypothetical protein
MRLIKLAAWALFGYALYEFCRGMLQDTQLGSRMGEAFDRATQGQGGRPQGAFSGAGDTGAGDTGGGGAGMNITGPGEGERVSTLEPDGGSVSHQVGRGVIS